MDRGVFIVIEGTDGSGKGTQFQKLSEKLTQEGYEVATFDFPQYELPSSYFVREYLNGKYGSAEDVGPYTGSLFYALDRYEAAPRIREALEQGKVVLANRFVGSNMAHQGTKFRHAEERRGYFIWLDNLEFEMLRVPRPTMSFVLRVPAETAQKLVDQKETRSYTDKKRDLHEADLEHLKKSVEVYDDLCQLFPRDFSRIDCTRDNKILDIALIHELIWQKVKPMLPVKSKKHVAAAAVPKPPAHVTTQNPLLQMTQGGAYEITDEGKKFLDEAVTSSSGNIYAFTHKLDPITVANAIARLSEHGKDLRTTVLTQAKPGHHESTQQFAGIHVVVEQASNLLAKKIERGRLASYSEQPSGHVRFDKRDSEGKYRYYVPQHFSARVKEQYVAHMDQIFNLYSEMARTLISYLKANTDVPKNKQDAAWHSAIAAQAINAIRSVLPVAASTTVGIHASGQILESLVTRLLSDSTQEAREVGLDILQQIRNVAPAFLKDIDRPERGGIAIAYRADTYAAVAKLANELLPDYHAADETKHIQMTGVWPRNELDLVADMLYEHSSLPLNELQKIVAGWPYDKKMAVFEVYLGKRLRRQEQPGRALEKAHYSWDLVSDYSIFSDLQQHHMVDDLEWQELTPRYGYELPRVVEDADLMDQFEACFDLSLRLYSILQEAGYATEAQYATLQGHRMRWKVTYNAREAFQFHEVSGGTPYSAGTHVFLKQMHEKLGEVHPLLAEAIKFVDKAS